MLPCSCSVNSTWLFLHAISGGGGVLTAKTLPLVAALYLTVLWFELFYAFLSYVLLYRCGVMNSDRERRRPRDTLIVAVTISRHGRRSMLLIRAFVIYCVCRSSTRDPVPSLSTADWGTAAAMTGWWRHVSRQNREQDVEIVCDTLLILVVFLCWVSVRSRTVVLETLNI